MTNQISKGTTLIAINPCIMDWNKKPALILGKQYHVLSTNQHGWFFIHSDSTKCSNTDNKHGFSIREYEKYFKIKS